MLEIPMTTVRIAGLDLPASGGGYFRLLPYPLTRLLLRRASRVNRSPAIFYLHPWKSILSSLANEQHRCFPGSAII